MSAPRRAVVFAGGQGTRLGSIRAESPKALLAVGDSTKLVDIVIGQLRTAGVERATFAVCHRADEIMDLLGDGSRYGIDIDFQVEIEPLGTAGSLANVEGLTDPFFVANCDVVTDLDFRDLAATHRREGYVLTIAASRQSFQSPFGVIVADEPHAPSSRVRSFDEKPFVSRLVNMGVYVADPSIRSVIQLGARTDMDQVVQRLVDIEQPVGLHAYDGEWMDIADAGQLGRLSEREAQLPRRTRRETVLRKGSET